MCREVKVDKLFHDVKKDNYTLGQVKLIMAAVPEGVVAELPSWAVKPLLRLQPAKA